VCGALAIFNKNCHEVWRSVNGWAIVGTILLVGIFSLLPMLRLFGEAVAPATGHGSAVAVLSRVLSSSTTWTATLHSLHVGIFGTVLSVVMGVGIALLVSFSDIRGRSILVFLYIAPLLIAPQITALAWLQLFGPASPLLKLIGLAPPMGSPNPLYSPGGIILLLGIQYSPLVFLIVRAGLRKLPRELIEAGLSNGASRFHVLCDIVLPLARPSIIAATALAFVSCIGNFGIPAFLGIPANYLVLPTLIYQRLAGGGPAVLSDVAILSILVAVMAVAGIMLQNYFMRRRDYRLTNASVPALLFELGRWRLWVEIGLLLLVAALLFLPLAGLFLTSIVPAYGAPLTLENISMDSYGFVLVSHSATARALLNSFGLSLIAAFLCIVIAVPLGVMMARQTGWWAGIVTVSIELPYALPGVVLAIAALLIFLKPVPLVGWHFYGSLWIILYAYLARFLVLALRPTLAALQQIDRTLEEAAAIVGARAFMRLRTIIFPLIAPVTLAGGILVFLTALCELTVSALLWASGSETLGVVIFSFEQGGDSNYAAAISLVIVVVTLSLMAATNLFQRYLPHGVLPWQD